MVHTAKPQRVVSRSGVVHAPYELVLFQELQSAIEFYERSPDALIQILHRAQELFSYLREDVVEYVARQLRVPLSKVYGVIGFYSFFSRVPQGKHTIRLCMGTACYVRGAEVLQRRLERDLNIKMGQTTSDGRYSLRCARCVGACGLAPVAMIDEDVHGHLKAVQLNRVLKAYK